MSGVKRWDHAVRWEGMKIAASYMAIKSGGKYILASDYDRDTQALRDDYNEACADAMQVAGKLQAVEAERDALRAQIEGVRELLFQVRQYVRIEDDDALLNRVDAALQEEWPKQQCPVTGAITDVDPADMGVHCTGHVDYAPPTPGVVLPEVSGLGRDAKHPRALILYLRKEPSDDDIRAIQEALRADR